MDPHAENYTPVSPYPYVGNNPIIRIDPDGRDWYEFYNEEGQSNVIWREGDAKSIELDGRTYSNIGTSYTLNIGNGASITYDQNTPATLTETVLNTGDWSTQRAAQGEPADSHGNKLGDEGNCFFQAGLMVSRSGATSLGGTANDEPVTNAVNYIDSQVNQGQSVRVHVDRVDAGTGLGSGRGRHWVAISSRTTNLQTQSTVSYGFYDPGTINQTHGTSPVNQLNVNNGSLIGPTAYSARFTYSVTPVRRNRR